MCLGLRGLRSFRGGRGHVVCVCADCLEEFVTFRECGDVAFFSARVRFLACDDASCWLSFLPSQVHTYIYIFIIFITYCSVGLSQGISHIETERGYRLTPLT